MSNRAELETAAAEIIRFAELRGGQAAVTEIATFGWKGDPTTLGATTPDQQFEVLNAIQDHAKSVSAGY
jgi:hypothetical protein